MQNFDDTGKQRDLEFSKGVPEGTYALGIDSWKTIESAKVGEIYVVKFTVLKGDFEGESFEQMFCLNADEKSYPYRKAKTQLAGVQWAALGGKNEGFRDFEDCINKLIGRKLIGQVSAETYLNGEYTNIRNEIRFAFTHEKEPKNRDGEVFTNKAPDKEELAKMQQASKPATPVYSSNNTDDDVPF